MGKKSRLGLSGVCVPLFALTALVHVSIAAAQGLPASECAFEKAKSETLASSSNTLGGILAVLFEYQKMAAKEAAEDRKIAQASKSTALQQKNAKLAIDNKQIESQMQESGSNAQTVTQPANRQRVTAIVAGAAQLASGSPSAASVPVNERTRRLSVTSDTLKRDLAGFKKVVDDSYAAAKSGRGRTPAEAELERIRVQLDGSLQQLNRARRNVKPCS